MGGREAGGVCVSECGNLFGVWKILRIFAFSIALPRVGRSSARGLFGGRNFDAMKRLLLILCFAAAVLPLRAQGYWDDTAFVSSCRPWVRWWWNGDMVDTVELKRELALLRDAGIGGVEINPIEFPAKRCDGLGREPLVWLSDAWLDALEATLREARRLGMGCDLLVGSGWPFGMESLPMEERAQVMLTLALHVDGDTALSRQNIFDAVDPQVTVKNDDRQFELVALLLAPDTLSSLSQVTALPLPAVGDSAAVALTGFHGYLYALVRCRSFASVINGAPGASGPILDHLNRAAVQRYLDYMSHTLEGRLGPMRNWLRAYFVDSMELEGSNWTDDFAEEFRRRRGYDLMPWLPFTMFKVGRLGDVVSYEYGAVQAPEFEERVRQVRHDFELTKAELLDERYTQTFLSWCRAQGVKSRAQAYGRGFFPLESSLGYDIPEGESWTTNYLRHRVGYEMGDEDYRRGRAYTMIDKYVSSAAHQAGCRLVSAEEMTNTYMIFNTPLELLKLGSDMSAFSGITHSVWHGFNYTPPEAGFPGWVQYGSYYNEQNTWWPYFHLLNDYRARLSALLQQAEMQTDIAILLPIDDLWAEYGVQTEPFPMYPKGTKYHVPQLLWEAVHKNGGNCDFITPRQMASASVEADGLHYGRRVYKALLEVADSAILVRRFDGRRDTLEASMPDSSRYLEWYAALQRRMALPHAVDIAQPDRFFLQNHYRTDRGEDMYFFANAHIDQSLCVDVAFPPEVCRRSTAWRYDCSTGRRIPLQLSGRRLAVALQPSESWVVVFSRERPKRGEKPAPAPPPDFFASTLGPWHVSLRHAVEHWDTAVVWDTLRDLRETDFADFSGTLSYSAEVQLDAAGLEAGSCWLSVPTSDICELSVNGHPCGTIWFGRRLFSIPSRLLRPGSNTLTLTVTTLLGNYARTLADDKVVQHFVLKRNLPTVPAGIAGPVKFW